MEKLIKEKLSEIENEYGIRILYACESGSRAWGFPSPNSDYDVRFIYSNGLDWHLSLRDQKDTLEFPINDELDIGGWEIKKALNLLWKSNPPLLEWIQSPIIYKNEGNFLSDIQQLSHQYFSPIASMHHYLSMSKKYLDTCDDQEVKLKKYFYALRTTIAGTWIREVGSMPHIELSKMFSVVPNEIEIKVKQLIEIKSSQNESYQHPNEPTILQFIKSEIQLNDQIANKLPSANGDFENLDTFYRKILKS